MGQFSPRAEDRALSIVADCDGDGAGPGFYARHGGLGSARGGIVGVVWPRQSSGHRVMPCTGVGWRVEMTNDGSDEPSHGAIESQDVSCVTIEHGNRDANAEPWRLG